MKTRREEKEMTCGKGRTRPRSFLVLLLGLILALGIGACEEKKKKSKKKKADKTASLTTGSDIEEESAAPAYIYSPVGKRDPFKSFYKVARGPEKQTAGGILTKFEIDQLQLIAIISGISKPRAQVELPDGKGVVIKVGTRIGKNFGRVVRIKNDEVVIAEDYRDWSGRKVTNYIHMKMEKESKKK